MDLHVRENCRESLSATLEKCCVRYKHLWQQTRQSHAKLAES
jgi:hypothetical protein